MMTCWNEEYKLGEFDIIPSTVGDITKCVKSILGKDYDKRLTVTESTLKDAPMWVTHSQYGSSREIFFNPNFTICKFMVYHELGHIFNNEYTLTHFLRKDNGRYFYKESGHIEWHWNAEYFAEKWAIDKCLELNDIKNLKHSIYWMFFDTSKTRFPNHHIAFKRLYKQKYMRMIIKKYCKNVYRLKKYREFFGPKIIRKV